MLPESLDKRKTLSDELLPELQKLKPEVQKHKRKSPLEGLLKDSVKRITKGSRAQAGGGLLSVIARAQSDTAKDVWAFEQDEDTSNPTSRRTSSVEGFDGLPRNLEEDAAKLKLHEEAEVQKHVNRLSLFFGDSVELEIATRKLQECRVRIIARFKTLPKAFDDLAGGRDALITLKALQEKLVRLLKFNSLDAQRVAAVMGTLEDVYVLNFVQFLNIFNFAAPVTTMLNFRARLVQQYGTIDAAFNVLSFNSRSDLSVDMFEKPMLGAGIVSADCLRLFQLMDKVQRNGPTGFLEVKTIRFMVDHAHVLAWLEILNSRLGGYFGVIAAFDKLPGDPTVVLRSAKELEAPLTRLGFPN
jgi:hypothetical protein